MRRLIVTLAMTLVATTAHADATGKMLYEGCGNSASMYYTTGVADMVMLMDSKSVCIPPAATNGQIRDVVCKWMKDNPQHRHEQAVGQTLRALRWGFPCKG